MNTRQFPIGDVLRHCLKALKALRDTERSEFGICLNFEDLLDREWVLIDSDELIQGIAATWPKFSGDISYPVPHASLSPEEAYSKTNNLWDKRTRYGQDRRELLEFIIATLEESQCT